MTEKHTEKGRLLIEGSYRPLPKWGGVVLIPISVVVILVILAMFITIPGISKTPRTPLEELLTWPNIAALIILPLIALGTLFLGIYMIFGCDYLRVYENGFSPPQKKLRDMFKDVFLSYDEIARGELIKIPKGGGWSIERRYLTLHMKNGDKYTLVQSNFLGVKEKGRDEWKLADREFDKLLDILKDKVTIQIVDSKTKQVIGVYGKEVADFSG